MKTKQPIEVGTINTPEKQRFSEKWLGKLAPVVKCGSRYRQLSKKYQLGARP